jgi:hypothetical protein
MQLLLNLGKLVSLVPLSSELNVTVALVLRDVMVASRVIIQTLYITTLNALNATLASTDSARTAQAPRPAVAVSQASS